MSDGEQSRDPRRRDAWLAASCAVLVLFLASCSDDDTAPDESAPTPGATTETTEVDAAKGDAILIRTMLSATEQSGRGKVLAGSLIGDDDFCAGGTFTDQVGRPEIGMVKTLRCPDGTLKLGFSPDPSTRVQNSKWQVLEGTERYAAMRGQGWMVVEFETGDPSKGRETYTGVVTRD